MKIVLDTDTRTLRRDKEGFYTVGADKTLCNLCGWLSMCQGRLLQHNKCWSFMPALSFQDEVGLLKVSNTMRVGRAWTQRLTPPQTVALYNVKAKVIFGYADVLSMDDGNIVTMLKAHAHANHTMLDTPNEEAPTKLGAWMKQNYGPRIINEGTALTAIYLLRLRQPPTPPYFQGVEAHGSGEGGPEGSGQAG